ncbi:MAG: radical SAM protein [Lachnospiraceae bacterium]|nr:radical SAM protein [Lachnospiraceae bacterium]
MAGGNWAGRRLGVTKSVCPECLRVVSAVKVERDGGIFLEKSCPEHGFYSALIWEGTVESYEAWGRDLQPADRILAAGPVERGCPLDCGLCEEHERRGCCVLLEVTDRCNLHCPVCFAQAGGGMDVPMEELGRQMDYLMSHGGPFNLQLSGGEPTMRDDLPDIIRMGREKGFSFFQLNTNGLRLAEEAGYAERLKEAGLSCVFLQFDGFRKDTYLALRGRPLFPEKEAAIDACERAGLGVVLVPVIAPGLNEDEVGAILDYALRRMPVVRGVHFQPISYFGRCREAKEGYRLTIPKLLSLMEEQTGGNILAAHFTGGNATNPYCTFQTNYLKQENGTLSPMVHGTARAYATSEQAREFVARQWSGPDMPAEESGCCFREPEDGGCCCGEDTAQRQFDTSSLDEFLVKLHNNTFAVSGMLFQDAWNLDLERLRRCYILETDSRYGMVPFCAYNVTSREGRTLYR